MNSAKMLLPVKLLRPGVEVPSYASDGAIGLDLAASGDHWLAPSGHPCRVATGIAVAIPEGYYGRLALRSGFAFRHDACLLGGVIDPDYRGEIFVAVANVGGHSVGIADGQRFAQLILERADKFVPDVVTELPRSARGAGGFGSTGK